MSHMSPEVGRLRKEIGGLRTALTAAQDRVKVLEGALVDIENLASDIEECSRLAHIDKGERRMLVSFGRMTRKIQAALRGD